MRHSFVRNEIVAVAGLMVIFCSLTIGEARNKKDAKDPLLSEEQEIKLPLNGSFGVSSEMIILQVPLQCAECKKLGKKSVVRKSALKETAKVQNVFTDAKDKKHDHSYETKADAFYCERDHWWLEPKAKGSCWCGWNVDRKKSTFNFGNPDGNESLSERELNEVRKKIAGGKPIDGKTANRLLVEIEELRASLKALKALFDPSSPIWKK